MLLYEPSIRVPLIVRGPGIPAGAHMDQLAANIDLAPTILDLAHAKHGHAVLDGRSLVPFFRHPWRESGRDLLIERPNEIGASSGSSHHVWTNGETGNGDNGNQGRPGTPFDRAYAAIRTPRFVYAEYASGAKELYDLWHDPQELQNIAGRRAYSAIQQELSHRLARLRTCRGAVCREEPDVRLTVTSIGRRESSGRCDLSRVRALVNGHDSRWVKSVRFFAAGRLRSLATTAPFTASFGRAAVGTHGKNAPRVRARILFVDGRRLDRVRPVPLVCR